MIAIIDYGMGNLRSVTKALGYLGAASRIVTTPKELVRAEKIILPGVGAFGDAMKELKARGLIAPLQDLARKNKKIMGVCLGLQLFFETSEEAPRIKGLGLLPGKVVRFRSKNVKVPHMGWNDLKLCRKHPLLDGLKTGDYFYFVHSYYGKPKSSSMALATCRYGKENFAAVVGKGNLFATQFHPEKSQAAGLKILKNFIAWSS